MNEVHPAAVAIMRQDCAAMEQEYLVEYLPARGVTFTLRTWKGRCTLPPLGLAIERAGNQIYRVLDVLIHDAGIDPSAPYDIEDHDAGVRIRTNALTHVLVRWNHDKSENEWHNALIALLRGGADAQASALFEMTERLTGAPVAMDADGRPSIPEASHLSLLALQMAFDLDVRPPFYFVRHLLEFGARFKASDPPGLFVTAISCMSVYNMSHSRRAEVLLGFLEEGRMQAMSHERGIDLAVQSIEPHPTGMNVLHWYVANCNDYNQQRIVQRIRMLCDVYGCNLMEKTLLDDRGLTDLAEASREHHAPHMRAAVRELMEEVLRPRHLALRMVQQLDTLPHNVVDIIGGYAGLPVRGARELKERIERQRRAKYLRASSANASDASGQTVGRPDAPHHA